MVASPSSTESPAPDCIDTRGAALRIKRTGPQLLDDELVAEEFLVSGAPTRNGGGRLLTGDKDPWTHNAWDKVEWDDEQQQLAEQAVERQMAQAVPPELQDEFNRDPAGYWDRFYANVKDGFFNDRAWLRTEFPELADALKRDAGPKRIVEIGCGPGNTLYPLFDANENPDLRLHGYDFSKEAVDLVKANPKYTEAHITSDVWDLSSTAGLPSSLEPGTVDIAIMIFVLSALHPDEWAQAVQNAWSMLKPGGLLLFRDYGRNDMAQLRFKANRFMQPGLYVRGDHTRVYFFERDELVQLFGGPKQKNETTSAPDPPSLDNLSMDDSPASFTAPPPTTTDTTITTDTTTDSTQTLSPSMACIEGLSLRPPPRARFELVQLGVDRRLLLNRKKMLKMFRIWVQGRWRKPV